MSDARADTLGVVRSWREREAVLGAVKGTAGVCNIDHTIRVDRGRLGEEELHAAAVAQYGP